MYARWLGRKYAGAAGLGDEGGGKGGGDGGSATLERWLTQAAPVASSLTDEQ